MSVRSIVVILITIHVIRITWYLLSNSILNYMSLKKTERSRHIESCDNRLRDIGTILGMRKMWIYKRLLRERRIRLSKERKKSIKKMSTLSRLCIKIENRISKKSDAIAGSGIFIVVVLLIYIQILLKL